MHFWYWKDKKNDIVMLGLIIENGRKLSRYEPKSRKINSWWNGKTF
jgi:hypothetical protein